MVPRKKRCRHTLKPPNVSGYKPDSDRLTQLDQFPLNETQNQALKNLMVHYIF
jgi:hypothetical protein